MGQRAPESLRAAAFTRTRSQRSGLIDTNGGAASRDEVHRSVDLPGGCGRYHSCGRVQIAAGYAEVPLDVVKHDRGALPNQVEGHYLNAVQ